MKKSLFSAACVLLLLFRLTSSSLGQNDIRHAKRAERAWKLLQPFLLDPQFIKLRPAKTPPRLDKFGDIPLSDENPNHHEGIFAMQNLSASLSPDTPETVSCYGRLQMRVINATTKWPSQATCQQIGRKFAMRHNPWFFTPASTMRLVTEKPTDTLVRRGIWTFRWEQPGKRGEEELFLSEVDVQVRAIDGKVVGFGSLKGNGWLPHKIRLPEAKKAAILLVKKATHGYKNVCISSWRLTETPLGIAWLLRLEATRILSGERVATSLYIDANSGDQLNYTIERGAASGKEIVWRNKRPEMNGSKPVVERPTARLDSRRTGIYVQSNSEGYTSLGRHGNPDYIQGSCRETILCHSRYGSTAE